MSQLRHQRVKLEKLNVKVKIVAFDNDLMAKAYAKESDLEWPILLDVDRSLYKGYGMTEGSWWNIYNPVSIIRYIILFLRGAKLGKPGSDWYQLGGDVIIDPDGIVRLHYASSDPNDRPSTKLIFETVESQDSL